MARPILARFGARILFGGDGLPVLTTGSQTGWDAVLLVEYPRRAAFAEMVDDSDYQQAFQVGASAVADIVLQPIKPDAAKM
jgi:uncharacterized protein (DUF1330 family)